MRDDTTANGIPIGEPLYRPEPKSGWTWLLSPMRALMRAEFLATGSRSTRWFHGFSAGNTGQFGAAGRALPDTSAGTTTSAEAASSDRQATEIAARRSTGQDTTAIPFGVTPNTASLASPM